jgi:hypothetical protein
LAASLLAQVVMKKLNNYVERVLGLRDINVVKEPVE